MMSKINGRSGTICQTLREVYFHVDDEALKYKLRVCMAMAKSMNRRLHFYNERMAG